MKLLAKLVLMTTAAISLAACGAPATNAPASNANATTNANTAKPTAAAPTADALLALDKQANDAYIKADTKFFDGFLSDKSVMSQGKNVMGKAGILEMIGKAKCEGVEVKLSEPQMSKIDNDTYALTYKNESTGKCNEGKDGAMVDIKPVRAGTVYARNGEKWQAVWHGENMIIDPKAPPPAPAKPDAKKEAPKKDDKPAANANSSANTAPPAAPAKSANTDALTKTHNAGWEAFMKKDANWFNSNLTDGATNVDPMGGVVSGKANVVKNWTETMKCEGITKTSFSDTSAYSVSPTVEILFGKGHADGKCDGQPNGDLYQTAVYVKEGDAWKLAFMFESMM